jgi:hypothetical protein
VNAGRNTYLKTVPHPPIAEDRDELGEEQQDSERRFLDHIHTFGIRLADYEDKP